jgi:hypothetical protein
MGPGFERPRVGLTCKIAPLVGRGSEKDRRVETGTETRVFQELKSCVYWIERMDWIEIGPEICSSPDPELGISSEMGSFIVFAVDANCRDYNAWSFSSSNFFIQPLTTSLLNP